jgi:hypothetical protein
MTPDYFQQKAAYNNKKDSNVVVSKDFQDFIDSLPKVYEPKAIRVARARQNGSIQSSD